VKLETDRIFNANAASLLQSGEAAIRGGDARIDMSSVQRCDSSAVALVLAWERAARACGLQLHLQGVPPSLSSLATLYGVESLIAVAS
jgi:phospholipid transport system transporter-binding protein